MEMGQMDKDYLGSIRFWLKSLVIICSIAIGLLWIFRSFLFTRLSAPPPHILSTPLSTTVKLGEPYRYDNDNIAEAKGGNQLVWSAVENSPTEFDIDPKGLISWKPLESGDFTVGIQVRDEKGRQDIQKWRVSVVSVPVFENPGKLQCKKGEPFTYQLKWHAHPPDVRFNAVQNLEAPGFNLNGETGTISFLSEKSGNYTILIDAANSIGISQLPLEFVVVDKDDAPLPEKAGSTIIKQKIEAYRKAMDEVDEKGAEQASGGVMDLNGVPLRYSAQKMYTTSEAKNVLDRCRNLKLTLVWHYDHEQGLARSFLKYGCIFGFFTPNERAGYNEQLFVVKGMPGPKAQVVEVPLSRFYGNYFLRFSVLNLESDGFQLNAVKRLKEKVVQACPSCQAYTMRLFLSYELVAVVLSEAEQLAMDHRILLEKDVEDIKWSLRESKDTAWIEIVSLTRTDGQKIVR